MMKRLSSRRTQEKEAASPTSSQPSSLRATGSPDTSRTLLKLQNDDWSDEDKALLDALNASSANGSANSSSSSVPNLDLNVVAQMMKTTVRKRSPRVRLFTFIHPPSPLHSLSTSF